MVHQPSINEINNTYMHSQHFNIFHKHFDKVYNNELTSKLKMCLLFISFDSCVFIKTSVYNT